MDEDKKTQDPTEGDSKKTTDPSSTQDGNSDEKVTESGQAELPERFKGKTAEQIAKDYVELQSTLGKQGNELGGYKKEIDQWRVLGKIIESNPALYKTIEDEIKKSRGETVDSQTDSQPTSRDDVRLATEDRIVSDFERKYGLDTLPAEKKKDLSLRIGKEIAEMYDPEGKKSVSEVLDSIPLHKLDRALDKAYRLATINDREEQTRFQTLIEAKQNNEASFGSIPSSSVNSNQQRLTEDEKKVARRMNISEQEYLKNKLALEQ